jgi:hypothetical protein
LPGGYIAAPIVVNVWEHRVDKENAESKCAESDFNLYISLVVLD